MNYPIIDLHCDLLGCVQENESALNFESPETNCSMPELLKGGVKLQTLAIFTRTSELSVKKATRQLELYPKLLQEYGEKVGRFADFKIDSDKLHFAFAIENASGLCDEIEPLEKAFERLRRFQEQERVLYVSLTWNDENRFGGGNATSIGLKADGKAFLSYLSGQGIAIDFSHTSDALAYDIINTIDQQGFDIPMIASHSNYRPVKDVPRNLPDDIASEIIKRKGLIGLNFVRRFVGEAPEDFIRHIEHGMKLGGEEQICFGADFYGPATAFPGLSDYLPTFQKTFPNSSCYPEFIALLSRYFPPKIISKIAYQNCQNFLSRRLFLRDGVKSSAN